MCNHIYIYILPMSLYIYIYIYIFDQLSIQSQAPCHGCPVGHLLQQLAVALGLPFACFATSQVRQHAGLPKTSGDRPKVGCICYQPL